MHSSYSDGRHSIAELLEHNHLRDQLNLIFADHVDKNTDWFSDYVAEIKKLRLNYPGFSVRAGCEVKILDDGSLNTRDDILDAAEVIVGSVHHFEGIKSMSREELLEKEYELTKALARHPKIDILGHPFSMSKRFYNYSPPREYVEEVYKLCAANGVKFEFNAKHAAEPLKNLVSEEIAKGNIDNFSFGSDVHNDLREIGDSAFDLTRLITVLVTGAGAGVGQSIIKSLKLSKVKTRIIATDMNHLAAGLYRADAAYIVPGPDDPTYLGVLEKICKGEGVEAVFIGTDTELKILSQNRDDFEMRSGAKVVVGNLEAVAISDDKWKTAEFLKSHNFPYVRSALADRAGEFLKEAGFPLVLKPRIGARSIGFQLVSDEPALLGALSKNPDLIVQEYLSEKDQEYTCGSFFDNGVCYGVIVMNRWLRDGDTYKAVAVRDKEIEELVTNVGKALKVEGPCNFQLRKSGGLAKIFEINCRFSGTTGAASFLGFNPVNAILQKLFFNRPFRPLVFRPAHLFRYWNEVFIPSKEVEKTAAAGQRKERSESDINIF